MELLIVIAIIAILMLIAIPTVGSLKKKANELSAIQSIHTIMKAENMYESNYPTNGFACSLPRWAAIPKSGAPSATSAQLIQPDLASGLKSGYIFTVTQLHQGQRRRHGPHHRLHRHGHSSNRRQDRRSRLLLRPVGNHQVRSRRRHQLHPDPGAMTRGWITCRHARAAALLADRWPLRRLSASRNCRGRLTSLTSPQPPVGAAPRCPALAQRVNQHYNKLHSLKAGFTESYAGLGMHRQESGTLLLLKPGRMRWDYSSPAGKLFLLDGKYAWFYTQGDAQVQRIRGQKARRSALPAALPAGPHRA